MSEEEDIPVLDDLIEKGIEITLSDLGLDDEPAPTVDDGRAAELHIDEDDAAPLAVDPRSAARRAAETYSAQLIAAASNQADPLADNPALEQAIRRILDEHMELAWQEIRLALQQHLERD